MTDMPLDELLAELDAAREAIRSVVRNPHLLADKDARIAELEKELEAHRVAADANETTGEDYHYWRNRCIELEASVAALEGLQTEDLEAFAAARIAELKAQVSKRDRHVERLRASGAEARAVLSEHYQERINSESSRLTAERERDALRAELAEKDKRIEELEEQVRRQELRFRGMVPSFLSAALADSELHGDALVHVEASATRIYIRSVERIRSERDALRAELAEKDNRIDELEEQVRRQELRFRRQALR